MFARSRQFFCAMIAVAVVASFITTTFNVTEVLKLAEA